MVTDTARQAVWQNLAESGRIAHFYTALTGILVFRRRVMRLLLSALGAIAALPLAADNFAYVSPWAGLAIVILVLIDASLQYDQKISKFSRTAADLRDIRREYRELWEKLETEGEDFPVDQLQSETSRLESKIAQVVRDIEIEPHKRLNRICAKAAYKEEGERYALG